MSITKIARGRDTSAVLANYMGGISYEASPLLALRLMAASSFFGEPAYYRGGEALARRAPQLSETARTMEAYIDRALEADFEGTLRLAAELRTRYGMRMNPQVIFVRAALHEGRKAFTRENPGLMRALSTRIIRIPTDAQAQFEYYLGLKGSKQGLPSILKRCWADHIGSLSRYSVAKYKRVLMDLSRIAHAYTPLIAELRTTGTVEVEEHEETWERLRSAGRSWREILAATRVPHMALLRNLRGILSEQPSSEEIVALTRALKQGVVHGKQFPFRYWAAARQLQGTDEAELLVRLALEECIELAMAHFPTLKGRTMCLSDNSGSARGAFTSQYGSVSIASIGNLSSVMTAVNSEEGWVGVFGDRLHTRQVSRSRGVLAQHRMVEKLGQDVGPSTECGIWTFFKQALEERQHWDNIFIYSDQQAGHGQLYVTAEEVAALRRAQRETGQPFVDLRSDSYVDVLSLVDRYRREVNPDVNVFSVQTGGYSNAVLPETFRRGALLAGWTGAEAVYAKEVIDIWNQLETSSVEAFG